MHFFFGKDDAMNELNLIEDCKKFKVGMELFLNPLIFRLEQRLPRSSILKIR